MTTAYLCRLLPLACLAPDIVEAIPDGRQLKGLSWRNAQRVNWALQQRRAR